MMTILSSARVAPTSSGAAYHPAFQPYGLRLPRRAPVITDVSPDGALQCAKGLKGRGDICLIVFPQKTSRRILREDGARCA